MSLARASPRGCAGADTSVPFAPIETDSTGVGAEAFAIFVDPESIRAIAGVCVVDLGNRRDPPPTTANKRPAATNHETTRVRVGCPTPGTIIRYGGVWRTPRSTWIDGAQTAAPFTGPMGTMS